MTRPIRPILLYIEDDRSSYNALRSLLRGIWDVRHCETLAQARAALDSGPEPDAILLDLMLPDGKGVEILRRVRDEDLESRVVVATGTFDPDLLDEVRSLRPDALVIKPCECDVLLAALGPAMGS